MELLGSPQIFIIALSALLLVFARRTRSAANTRGQSWLERALILAMAQAGVLVAIGVFASPPPVDPSRALAGQAIAAWSAALVDVVLIAGFLRLYAEHHPTARLYAIGSTSAITLMLLAGLAAALLDPRFAGTRSAAVARAVEVSAVLWGGVLAARAAPHEVRAPLSAGIGLFALSGVVGLAATLLVPHPGPGAAQPLILGLTGIGFILLAYVFLHTRTSEMHMDRAVLEEKVLDRTRELESAMSKLSAANALLLEQSTVDAFQTLATEYIVE